MSTLGKVLAVFNVLMALAIFFYFFPTHWGIRQGWAYSYFRHELVLDGLPLNDQAKDTEGHLLKDKLSETTLKQMFQGAGEPVSTQMQEVEGVRSDLNKLQNENPARLTEILSNMARTGGEREEILAKKPADVAAIFEEVDNAKDMSPAALRAAIAHLLFNCYGKEEREKRILIVVGLKEYTREVNEEADALVSMTARVRRAMQRDLSGFEAQYAQLIKDIQILAEKIEDAKTQLEFQEQLTKSHNSLVMKRTQDVEGLKKAILDARLATRKATEELTKEQKLYFQFEDEAGQRAKENQDLEREIRKREHVEK